MIEQLDRSEHRSEQRSEQRAAINRANSQHSTGPVTAEGKARSSQNSLKHGLYSRAITLPADDLAAYRQHVQEFFDEYHPRGATESQLVQALADITWKRNRIVRLESELFIDDPEHPRSLEIQVRALNTFGVHSARLNRDFENTLRDLKAMQAERIAAEKQQMIKAIQLYEMDKEQGDTFDPAADGFVFSIHELDTFIRRYLRSEAAQQAAKIRATAS